MQNDIPEINSAFVYLQLRQQSVEIFDSIPKEYIIISQLW